MLVRCRGHKQCWLVAVGTSEVDSVWRAGALLVSLSCERAMLSRCRGHERSWLGAVGTSEVESVSWALRGQA